MNARVQIEPAVRTTCPYCGVGCGLIVQPDGHGGAAMTGDPTHPANFGRLCSKGSALGETLGLEGRLLHPMLRQGDGTLVRAGWPQALDAVAQGFGRIIERRRAERGRLLSLRPAADRGLLRRQQADEGLPRLGQCRHQFAAVHGLLGRRPSPRLRRRHRAGQLRRPRRGRPRRAGRLECRLVPSGAVPAHDAQQGRARRAHRRDRSAPHRDGRRSRPVSADRAGHRHGAVLRAAGRISPNAARSIGAYIDAHTSGFAEALARAREIAPDVAATARATGLDEARRRAFLRPVRRHARASSPAIRKASTSRRRAPTRSTPSSTATSPPAASASPAWGRSR